MTPPPDQPAVSDGTMPCPVPHPDGDPDKPCVKKIPNGWTADEGHAGGHMWMDAATMAVFDTGHYDAVAAISGQPFGPHAPEDCDPSCGRYLEMVKAGVVR